jgi:hypothetical protein
MSKPVKKIGKGIRRVGRKLDSQLLVKFQKNKLQQELGNLGKTLTGAPKIEQAKPAAPIKGDAIRPLAAMGSPNESQEAATKDLYRRRRARGVATGPAGLTGEASVRRKKLLGG